MPEKHQPERFNIGIIAGPRGFGPDAHLDSGLSDGISVFVSDERDICFLPEVDFYLFNLPKGGFVFVSFPSSRCSCKVNKSLYK